MLSLKSLIVAYMKNRFNIELKENQSLQVRAANHKRPDIRLSDRPDQFSVSGESKEYNPTNNVCCSRRIGDLVKEARGCHWYSRLSSERICETFVSSMPAGKKSLIKQRRN